MTQQTPHITTAEAHPAVPSAAREPAEMLTAKQRLAVSRQLLCLTAHEPLWASVVRLYIRRGLAKLEAKKQSDREANGRTPS